MIFGKLFREPFIHQRRIPELAPRNFGESPGAALEYALWMKCHGKSGIFTPTIISFSGAGTPQAHTLVARHVAPCNGEKNGEEADIGEILVRAEAAFGGLPKGDWEIFLHEGRIRRDDGFMQDCFIGHARNNLTGEGFPFLRPFQFDGENNVWAGDIRRIACLRSTEGAERLRAAPFFRS